MSRLNEYNPDFGVVFDDPVDVWLRDHPGLAPGGAGGHTIGTMFKPGEASPPPATRPGAAPAQPPGAGNSTNYAQQNASEKAALQLAGGGLRALPGTAQQVGTSGSRAIVNGVVYTKDPTTSVWTTSGFTPSKADVAASLATRQQQNTQQQNTGLRNAIATSALPAEQRTGTAIANSAGMMGTLPSTAGPTIPGFEQYNQPGLGIAADGSRTYSSGNGLNTVNTGHQGSLPAIPVIPGVSNNGEQGNSIPFGRGNPNQFGGRGEPQMLFPSANVTVPGTYAYNQGNSGDSNRAYSVPFNIGPGGASLANIAGNNVQISSADKGTGTGFALNAMPASNFFNAISRNEPSDPATQAVQALQIQGALNQLGGGSGAIQALTALNANQFGGYHAGTSNNPFSGNGGSPQGTWFAGAAPGPQNNVNTGGQNPASTLAGLVADRQDEAGLNDEGVQGYSRGGVVVMLPRRARASRPLGFASGGSVTTQGPGTLVDANPHPFNTIYTDTPPPLPDPSQPAAADANPHPFNTNYTDTPQPAQAATSAPLRDGALGDTGGGVQSPQNGDGIPIDNGGVTLPVDVTSERLLDPFTARLRDEAARDRLRDSSAYQWGLAGRKSPTAVDVPLDGTANDTLPQGLYYSRTRALNDRINAVHSAQQDYMGLGPLGNEGDLLGQITTTEQAQEPIKQALAFKTQLLGLGPDIGDPTTIQTQLSDLKQKNGPLADIADAQKKLTALGDMQDTEGAANAIAMQEQRASELQQAMDEAAKAGQPAPPALTAELTSIQENMQNAKALLSSHIAHNNEITQTTSAVQNLMAQAGLTPDQLSQRIGEYSTQADALKMQYERALQASELSNKINALTGGVDPTQAMATYGTKLSGLNLGLANVRKGAELSNRIKALTVPPAGFKGGGAVASMPLPRRAKKSMVTPEEIIGIGKQTGKPYFRVGEPRTPGGPPAPEKLTIKPLPMGKRKGRIAA